MDSNSENAKRVPNFTSTEKHFLLSLISTKYAQVIEDKKTNRISLEDKNRCWKNIEHEFNANASIACYRSAETLKRFYENKKKELRRKMAEDKKSRFLTGGGPAPTFKLDDTDEILLSIVNEKTIKGFNVTCDSDADFEAVLKKSHLEPNPELTFTVVTNDEHIQGFEHQEINDTRDNMEVENHQYSKDWKKYKTTDLQSPLNKSLQESQTDKTRSGNRRRPTNSVRVLTSSDVAEKYNILLDKRLILINKQIEQATEQQSFQREEHKLKQSTLKNKQELQDLKKQEQSLKVELLKLDISYKKALLANI